MNNKIKKVVTPDQVAKVILWVACCCIIAVFLIALITWSDPMDVLDSVRPDFGPEVGAFLLMSGFVLVPIAIVMILWRLWKSRKH
jgi:hypothetical protein